MNGRPIIVNLCGAPGAGKSTGAAYIFAKLKMAGVNAEQLTEFAKDKTWEHNFAALKNQLYIFAKQYYKIARCKEQVDVIITDSPIILSLLYDENLVYKKELDDLVLRIWKEDNNVLYYVNRVKPYNPIGRNQTEQESDELSVKLKECLKQHNLPYKDIVGDVSCYDVVVDDVIEMLKKQKAENVSP